MPTRGARRLPTKEELEYLRKKREEVASQLRALGITREQLEREALEIVRAIREGKSGLAQEGDTTGIDSRKN